jgi:hypothetical protein
MQRSETTTLKKRRPKKQLVAVGIVIVLGAVLWIVLANTGSSKHGSSTPKAARALLAQVNATATAEGSLSYIQHDTEGKNSEEIRGVISAAAASVKVTASGPSFDVELLGQLVYVKGGSTALKNAMGLKTSSATVFATKWISVTTTQSIFTTITSPLTVATSIASFEPTAASVTIGKEQKLDGHEVIPLEGQASQNAAQGAASSVALFVSATKPFVPLGGTLEVQQKGSPIEREVIAFKNWGAPVKLKAPKGAVPFTSIPTN